MQQYGDMNAISTKQGVHVCVARPNIHTAVLQLCCQWSYDDVQATPRHATFLAINKVIYAAASTGHCTHTHTRDVLGHCGHS